MEHDPDQKLQDFHSKEQQQDSQKEAQWGTSIDGVIKNSIIDSKQWLSAMNTWK